MLSYKDIQYNTTFFVHDKLQAFYLCPTTLEPYEELFYYYY